MPEEMRKEFGHEFLKDKLKNRLKTIKKQFSILKALLNGSGFGWDDCRKCNVYMKLEMHGTNTLR